MKVRVTQLTYRIEEKALHIEPSGNWGYSVLSPEGDEILTVRFKAFESPTYAVALARALSEILPGMTVTVQQ